MVMVEPPDTMRPWRKELPGGARHGQRIDAYVALETPILVGQQHAHEVWIHAIEIGLEPPVAGRGGERPEQLAVAVAHFRRDGLGPFERRRIGPVEFPDAGRARDQRHGDHIGHQRPA
jgi:hypothetical protein